ncbi:MAG TPA: hypothetical protein VK155_12765 [Bacteroidales bacterium]|jgi:hypothetical protein|nr:hypothetical protein [Bacteroidales bacterium]
MLFIKIAKKMLLPVVLILLSGIESLHAQDVLMLKSGRELKVIITEETPDIIKYREFENATGPLYSIDKTKVESVKYSKKARTAKENQPNNVVTPAKDELSAEQPSSETLTVKKRYVLQDGRVMSTRQVKTIMEDNQQALELYTKGHKQCNSSNACAYGIIGTCLAANLVTNKMEGDSKMTILGTALAISGGLVISGIVLASSGKKKIRRSVDLYNSGANKPVSYKLDFKISGQGVGVALRF